ncbi:hypothetical protein PTSG_00453 [Salpingoeca rosetta]|uniref:Uncharacterized protein n=1 Tax=Salpingoeca rosetta (strain ATCC 50818 / BSB-021) TaxID=946362 RepID=F2TWI8_SALR5|nr:uncharacterized protein PTSG_00453 [Salpingoeca rosetta]EGD72434.1 hypothetical protein PTSG_00453 [Salpingoeca rosetta]|eukprot:XP_004999003.1 hypothetical protein PTSG_00453 [Salpingoeca rosetta]
MFAARAARAVGQAARRSMSTTARENMLAPEVVPPKSYTPAYIALGTVVATAVFLYRTRKGIWYDIKPMEE